MYVGLRLTGRVPGRKAPNGRTAKQMSPRVAASGASP